MQLYRGMDIGTAKVTPDRAARSAAPPARRLVVREPASVATYQRLARRTIAEVDRQGSCGCPRRRFRPLPAGSPGPTWTSPAPIPRCGSASSESRPNSAARRCTPGSRRWTRQAAATIPASNSRRVVRALEVVEVTGGPYTATMPDHRYLVPAEQFGLSCRVPSSTSGSPSASTGCGSGVWWRRYVDWSGRGCARGRRRAARSATPRCCAISPGSAPRTRPGRRPCGRPGASSAARTAGSGPIPRVRWLPSGPAGELADRIVGHLRGVAELPDSR